jgi:hypothetical protein
MSLLPWAALRSDSEHIWLRIYLRSNISDSEHIWFQTYLILDLSDYWTNSIQNQSNTESEANLGATALRHPGVPLSIRPKKPILPSALRDETSDETCQPHPVPSHPSPPPPRARPVAKLVTEQVTPNRLSLPSSW